MSACGLIRELDNLGTGELILPSASGEAVMPVPAMLKLVGVIPDALLSHLLDPVGRHIAENGEGDFDADALGLEANGLAGEVAQSRSPQSPGGTNIVPIEKQAIRERAQRVVAKAVAA